MAENSEKENVTAGTEEKDQDTSIKVDSKPNSRPASKPGSAKSASGGTKASTPKSARAKSPKSPKSARSDKSGKKSGKKKPGSAKANEDEAQNDMDPELAAKLNNFTFPEELPPGAESLFLASKTQELFSLGDAAIATEHPLVKIRAKKDILADVMKRAAVSDFSPIKKKIQDYPEDNLVVIADLDYKFGENFVILLTTEAKDALLVAPEVSVNMCKVCKLNHFIFYHVKCNVNLFTRSHQSPSDQIHFEVGASMHNP